MSQSRNQETEILEHLLRGVGIENYAVENGYVAIPFLYSNSDLFEEGEVQIWLYASFTDPIISLEMPLLELGEGEDEIDSSLTEMLGRANRQMDSAQFIALPGRLSLGTVFDSRELQPGEIEAGVSGLFVGFELYLRILAQWFGSLADSGTVKFEQTQTEKREIEKVVSGEQSSMEPVKQQVIQALVGIASVGLGVAVIGAIGSGFGMPAATVASLIVAYLGGKAQKS